MITEEALTNSAPPYPFSITRQMWDTEGEAWPPNPGILRTDKRSVCQI